MFQLHFRKDRDHANAKIERCSAAKANLGGRLYLCALACTGQADVEKVQGILRAETDAREKNLIGGDVGRAIKPLEFAVELNSIF